MESGESPPPLSGPVGLGPSPRPCRNCRMPYKRLDAGRCPRCAAYRRTYRYERPPWSAPEGRAGAASCALPRLGK
jgi:hypothetical protein